MESSGHLMESGGHEIQNRTGAFCSKRSLLDSPEFGILWFTLGMSTYDPCARLIQKICKEWGKRQAQQAFAQASEIAIAAVQVFDLAQPRLPIIPFVSTIESHSEKGKVYEVNLAGPTCTCPDWRNFRHRHPEQHLTRCCKHVFDAFSQFEPPQRWPGWLRAFFELAWTPHPQQEWVVLQVDNHLVLISNAPNGWANVFASDQGPYDRYGYSVIENRWAYGIAPPNVRRIEKAVLTFATR